MTSSKKTKKPPSTLPPDIEVQDMVDITVYYSVAVESVGYDGMAREEPFLNVDYRRQPTRRAIHHLLRSGDALRGIVIRKGEVIQKSTLSDYSEIFSVPTCDVLVPELGPIRFVCGVQGCFVIRKIYPEEGDVD